MAYTLHDPKKDQEILCAQEETLAAMCAIYRAHVDSMKPVFNYGPAATQAILHMGVFAEEISLAAKRLSAARKRLDVYIKAQEAWAQEARGQAAAEKCSLPFPKFLTPLVET